MVAIVGKHQVMVISYIRGDNVFIIRLYYVECSEFMLK